VAGRNRLASSLFRGSVGGGVGALGRGWAVVAVPTAFAHMGKTAGAVAAGVTRRRYGGTVRPALVARGGGVVGQRSRALVRRGGGGVRAGALGRQGRQGCGGRKGRGCQAFPRAGPLWARSRGIEAFGGGRELYRPGGGWAGRGEGAAGGR